MTVSDFPLILVVDDDKHAVRRVEKTLVPQGYHIATAYDGEEALRRAAETPPDLVVLDVLMPGLDGFDTARALRTRAESRAIPILMVTALNELDDKIKGLEAGADDFLSKPFNTVELIARVRSLLRIKQLHDELQARNTLLERLLTRYVSKEVAHEILLDPRQDLRLNGQSCEVSVLFANIRGFTRFSEQLEAAQVTQTLNFIFHHLATIIFEHQGTLDKYLGDAIMAFYGAPIPSSDYPVQALRTAWAMQRRFAQLGREDPTLSELGIGIGLSTGEAVVGSIGSERMVDYTVLGHTPNTAQRLQGHAQKGQILMDERTYQAVQEIAVARPVELPNLHEQDQSALIYEVLAVKEPIKV
jgi:adenylate cyclase